MTRAFEFVRYSTHDGFEGVTFGYTCCVTNEELSPEQAEEALFQTYRNYQSLASTYWARYRAVRQYKLDLIKYACETWNAFSVTQIRLSMGLKHLRNPGSAGTIGRSASKKIDELQAELKTAFLILHHDPTLIHLAESFGHKSYTKGT